MADVAIVGMGVVNSLGNDLNTFSESLQQGKIGYKTIPLHEQLNFRSKIASYPDESKIDYQSYGIKMQDLLSCDDVARFTLAAASQAVRQAGISEEMLRSPDCGVLIGSGLGGGNEFADLTFLLTNRQPVFTKEKKWKVVNPRPRNVGSHKVDSTMASTCSANTSVFFKTQGMGESLSSACSTGLGNIGYAYRMIKHGYQKRVICGGSETSCWNVAAGFDAMMVLSPTGSLSLSGERSGFVAGAGAGIVVLEELQSVLDRGAKPLAVIKGFYSGCCGSGNMTAPSREGQIRCVEGALADGHPNWESKFGKGWKPDIVKLHGTATPTGDAIEVKSVVECFGKEGYHLTAPKALFGHLLGAAGSVELICAVDMLQKGYVVPNINCDPLDPELEFVTHLIPRKIVKGDFKTALCISFGFGSTNAGMIIEKV
ncbi:MAG: beta-ketoacyl-[acyl-carrier-protein] synthase family protein [Candidatus Margulisiibacteriota bacterium]|nr:beta-ketoacyl-[acyl-carrier-protein] synthase family protein [Candidatus Margulisiibacteriota bacterium]